jgi:hypothetical protein
VKAGRSLSEVTSDRGQELEVARREAQQVEDHRDADR